MIKYSINNDKKTVAAFFDGEIDCNIGYGKKTSRNYWINCIVSKAAKLLDSRFIDSNAVIDAAYIEATKAVAQLDSITGVATENDGIIADTIKKRGVEIAKARLLRRYYRTERNVLMKVIDMITKEGDRINVFEYNEGIDRKINGYERSLKELRCSK